MVQLEKGIGICTAKDAKALTHALRNENYSDISRQGLKGAKFSIKTANAL
jgi:hypothetical protein